MNSTPDKLGFLLDLQDSLGGSIPFARWMQEALYHPDFGYYSANIRGLGRTGDFTTWPLRQQNLGRAIARWARDHRPKGPWRLIEVGAGTGDLAAAVRRTLGWWRRPEYHIVEVSAPLRAAQQEKLCGQGTWHATMAEALAACEGCALIYSNELADAFPCRIFQKHEEGWRELALRIEGGKIFEAWLPGADFNSTAFPQEWPMGQRIEVLSSYQSWLADWSPQWKQGAMLTIDYGDLWPEIYRRRPHGTLRAYAHHQRLEGTEAYAGFGTRDLTSDVNFSDLQLWAQPAASEFLSLGAFLERYGETVASEWAEPAAAFKALLQTR